MRRDRFKKSDETTTSRRQHRGRHHRHHRGRHAEASPSPQRVFFAALTVGVPALFGMIQEALRGRDRW